jgi:chromosome segregation ATPase
LVFRFSRGKLLAERIGPGSVLAFEASSFALVTSLNPARRLLMPRNSIRRLVTAILALILIAGFLLVDTSAQKRRRRRRTSSAPRIENPAIYQPSPADNTNSAADTSNNDTAAAQPARKTGEQDPEAMKKTIRTLSVQVDKLTDKISQMEESQRSLVDLERLSRAETRSAALRAELRDVQAKQSDLQAKAEDVDYALKPENIERSTSGYGTTHPEELRAQRRQQLENEKQRLRKQLDQLAASEARLNEAIAASDAEIDRLRKKLDAADEAAIQNAKTKAQSEDMSPTESAPRPTPTPSPYPR